MAADPPRSVLIVEDEGILAEDLQESLVDMGYDAFAIAASGDEAIEHVSARRPDLILMDIRIQGDRDGIETAALLRERHDVPIVYLTAHADDATISRAKLTTPYGYLVKPVKSGELRSAIELSLYRHELERKHRQMQHQLEVVDRLASLATLTGGLAHEVNNPLAVVIANAEYAHGEIGDLTGILRAGGGPGGALADRVDGLSQVQAEIVSAGLRIGKIVADLKELAHPTELPSGEADPARAIRWALRTTTHEFRRRARLIHDIAALPPVIGDEARLGQVFVNLLRNAAQAIVPGRIAEHEVAIAARAEGERIVIEVRDNGPGIRPDHLKRIFEPFFTTRGVGQGTGLGLSVCHGIVTSLRGEITVESQLGRGATFRVVLPAALAATAPPLPARAAAPPRRARILVVDHDAMIQRTMVRLLRDHDVVCVDSAPAALAALAAGARIDVIFADVTPPAGDAIRLYHEVRARDSELARQIVFVTAAGHTPAATEDFLRSVPNLALDKPFGQPELESVISLLIADAAGG